MVVYGDSPVLCPAFCFHVRRPFIGSRSLGFERKICDKFHIQLNTGARPIANKYCEGKMKMNLERELKVPELAEREAIKTFVFIGCRGVLVVSLFLFPLLEFVGLACPSPRRSLGFGQHQQVRVTIIPVEGRPLAGCYSLRFVVPLPAEVCFRAFVGSTFEYRRSAMLSLTVSTDPS